MIIDHLSWPFPAQCSIVNIILAVVIILIILIISIILIITTAMGAEAERTGEQMGPQKVRLVPDFHLTEFYDKAHIASSFIQFIKTCHSISNSGALASDREHTTSFTKRARVTFNLRFVGNIETMMSITN